MNVTRTARRAGIAAVAAAALTALALAAPALHLLGSDPLRLFASAKTHPSVAAVYVSGDMGLRFGMGPKVAPALAAHGMPVVGVSSSVNFATHRTRAEADAILAHAVRTALSQTGARRVVLVGQSFGADIISATAADLPPALRQRVAAIALVVPGENVFFRADPTGITYHGTPDAEPAAGMRALDWAPVICIHGMQEHDSLCPMLDPRRAQVIALPGGHFLRNDHRLLTASILNALARADPTILA